MLTRRDFLQVAAAAAVATGAGAGGLAHAARSGGLTQDKLLEFDALGQVTLLNFTDIHAQLVPLWYREPSVNIGVGEVHGLPPHLTGEDYLKHFGLRAKSPEAHALTHLDFAALAQEYGRVGGLDRMATLVNAIRAERPGKTLLIDNGDTWQGSYTALMSRGEDMVDAMNQLGVDVMTAHWEFTYGEDRVQELIGKLKFPFLAGNVKDTEWEEYVFPAIEYFERGGVKIAVIGQAFPYTPIANPRHFIPKWSFGIDENRVRENIARARENGAQLVVLASHNGFDVDRKLASRVDGIDVLLTGHTHDAVPDVVKVGDTLLVSTGSHGKFLGRLDLKIDGGRIADHRFKLIPVFSDAIQPDPDMAKLINRIRAPHAPIINRVLGRTEQALYRRGNFNGTFDDLILQAIMAERDTEIAFSPGFRWGSSLPPGENILVEHVYNQTAITYPNCTRTEMTGEQIKTVMEDVADNLFNPDPYYQQGGDMVRVGGMGYAIDVGKPAGSRISDMIHLATGKPIDPKKTYVVGGWASVRAGAEGPPIYSLLGHYIQRKKVIDIEPNQAIKVKGG